MHVVIVGCGRVGSTLAKGLTDEGNTVSIIDRRTEPFSRLGPAFTGKTFLGIGFDRDLLVEAGIEEADAVAAVTNGDNSNILVARVARESFGVKHVVARIYDPRRAAIYQRLGIATVATALWTTEQILRRMIPGSASVEWVDPSAKVSLVQRELGKSWVGRNFSELDSVDVRVVAVTRLGTSILPTPQLVVQEGDLTYLAVSTSTLPQIDEVLEGASTGGHR